MWEQESKIGGYIPSIPSVVIQTLIMLKHETTYYFIHVMFRNRFAREDTPSDN